MGKYAVHTKVPAVQSRAEIEKTLARYGAEGFLYGQADGNAMVMFRMNDRHIKFTVPLPEGEKPIRQRWRALLLVIKAKLESVESDIETFEAAFMANIVLPDGKTVGEIMRPQIKSAYDTGNMPPLLPHYGSDSQ